MCGVGGSFTQRRTSLLRKEDDGGGGCGKRGGRGGAGVQSLVLGEVGGNAAMT